MPSRAALLAQISRIVNEAYALALAWHVVLAAFAIALLVGFRPTRRFVARGVAAMTASVSLMAFAFGNPFNGTTFALLTVAMIVLRVPRERLEPGPTWAVAAGAAMIVFGCTYPHFLQRGGLAYLAFAPVALIPCPTLATAIGIALASGGLGGRAWTRTLAAFGIAYGIIGLFWLEVTLDAMLLTGATALFLATTRSIDALQPRPRLTP